MVATPVSERVRKRRDALRASGLRPVQIWVPDTRPAGFVQECRRQSRIVAEADAHDRELQDFMDTALTDLLNDGGEA
jgi:L-alanine-DL-glutamate epimerase-like enolase superfamily enzyme